MVGRRRLAPRLKAVRTVVAIRRAGKLSNRPRGYGCYVSIVDFGVDVLGVRPWADTPFICGR